MNKLTNFVSKLGRFVPLQTLISLSGQTTIFPFYHIVSDSKPAHIRHLYPVKKIDEFEKDLEVLLKHYEPIGLEELRKTDQQGPRRKAFLLTFDDGLREFKEVVAPILLRKGIPAICFLNSGFIDNKNLFYRHKVSVLIEHLNALTRSKTLPQHIAEWFSDHKLMIDGDYLSLKKIRYAERRNLDELAELTGIDFNIYLSTEQPYLNLPDIKYLKTQGFYFGAHSIDHPPFEDLTLEEQAGQLKESLAEVIGALNIDYRLFAFPFSDRGVSKAFLEDILYGNPSTADFTFGTAGLKQDIFSRHLQRIPMEKGSLSASIILKEEYLRSILRTMLRRNRVLHSTDPLSHHRIK